MSRYRAAENLAALLDARIIDYDALSPDEEFAVDLYRITVDLLDAGIIERDSLSPDEEFADEAYEEYMRRFMNAPTFG